jgi:predicted O-methyltransferase YrrM
MAQIIRSGEDRLDTYVEAFKAFGNKWAASADVLHLAANLARSSELPILEMGTGLSTIILAAASKHKVWAVEHDPQYAAALENMAAKAGVSNIALSTAPLKDNWYDLEADSGEFPEQFGLAFVDGPPRYLGAERMRFFEVFGDRCKVILCDDANSPSYAAQLKAWAASKGRKYQADGRAAVILPPEA